MGASLLASAPYHALSATFCHLRRIDVEVTQSDTLFHGFHDAPVASTTEITMPSVAGNLVQAPVPSTHSEGCAANEFPWDQNPPVALGECGCEPCQPQLRGSGGLPRVLRSPPQTRWEQVGCWILVSQQPSPPIADIAATLTPAERLQLIRRDANAPLAYCGGGVSIDTSREMHAAALLREERRATLCSAKLETTSVPQDISLHPTRTCRGLAADAWTRSTPSSLFVTESPGRKRGESR